MSVTATPERIAGHPVGNTENRLYFADDSQLYAGKYLHEASFPVHTHSFVEIAVPVSGRGAHSALAGRRELSAGDVVLLRPGLWHGYEDCTALEVFNCCISTDLLRHELGWTRDDPLLGRLLWTGPYALQRRGMLDVRLDRVAHQACLEQLEAIDALRRRPAARYRADAVGRLVLFLGELARAFTDGHDDSGDRSGPTHPSVVQAMRLLESRLNHPWTLVELADELHLAPSYLVRLFRSSTGQPPMAYLARHRVETAAAMLLDTDLSISQIADAIGWPDQNYFARRFKAHFGLTASAYRGQFHDRAIRLRGNEVNSVLSTVDQRLLATERREQDRTTAGSSPEATR